MNPAGPPDNERRVGIFGGTFNPIHRGHMKAARAVATALALDRVIFIPSALPPHKTHLSRDPIAPAEDRSRWVELAIADEPLFELNGIELEREGASYSVDTLRTLAAELAPARLVFILGYDAFIEMGTWRDPEKILAMVDVVVVSRPPITPGHLSEWLPEFARELVEIAPDGRSALNRESDTRIDLLEIDALDISASQIRSELASGRSITEQVPESVEEAIVSSGHYQRGSQLEKLEDAGHDEPSHEFNPELNPELNPEKREKLAAIVEAALERNAQDPVALDVHALTSYTDCLIIVSGNSTRQVRAIADHVVSTLKARGEQPLGVEGGGDATWMLIDANDVIVHVFEPDTRELFDIEGLWEDAPRVPLDLPQPKIA
ncbi:MAG: nicotinate (nicotinamide) nucleotide adenylyltransferase, partial [Deltaproteobacteria bacterium]|nr:nicotinate (nicotinamide) nucleotide adenylyltransferase [Deltaproteobacteria bacterium]